MYVYVCIGKYIQIDKCYSNIYTIYIIIVVHYFWVCRAALQMNKYIKHTRYMYIYYINKYILYRHFCVANSFPFAKEPT